MTLLHWALLCEDKDGFILLLTRNADPNVRLDDGAALMPLAATHPDPAYLEAALKGGGSPSLADGKSYTPLMRAILNRRVRNAERLLEAGANVDAITTDGFTALAFAVGNDSMEQVQLLLHYGADPLAPGEGRFNALGKSTLGADPAIRQLLESTVARRRQEKKGP